MIFAAKFGESSGPWVTLQDHGDGTGVMLLGDKPFRPVHSALWDAQARIKELDAYHMLMMATWHPAKDKNDLAPIRAKATDMVASAKLVAASKSPTTCRKPELLKAQAALPAETEKVAAMVTAKVADAELKAGLKRLHDSFDLLEGCAGSGMKH